MYCPSCDKSYGAVHSRCPECHSWLKVSAPSSARKGGKSSASSTAASSPASAPEQGGVSTLDRDSGSSLGGSDGGWADPAPSSPSNWGDSGGEGWDSGPGAGAASSGSDGWGGGAGPGASAGAGPGASSSWSGNDNSESYGWGSEPGASSTASAPSGQKDSGWLDGGGSQDGWGGGPGGAGASAPSPAPGSGGGEGWLNGGGPEPSAGASSGWLGGGGPEPAAGSSSSGSGWLGDSSSATAAPSGGGGGGWLGDSADAGAAPSMTEMVDQAISVEESDDFVDDSWVDEEIRENDFDDLDIPEYAPPAPEVGGAFLKMLLVAVLVLLVGGGILFANNKKDDPEKTAADETTKRLEFGRATVKSGTVDLEAGKPGLAVPQFQEALVALSDGKAPQDEIYDAEVLLGKALMGDEEYKEAYKHYKSLKDSGQEKYVAEGESGMQESSRQLRIKANEYLAEAKKYAAKEEITSVKRLGRDALDLYEEYEGSNSQMGDAHGVIGRGHYNGREYAQAKDEFKKAVALAPGIGYESYLNKVSNILAPKQYIPPVQSAPRRTTRSTSKPSFSLGKPNYQRSSGRSSGRRRSSSSGGNSSAGPAPSAPKKKMKEIPAYRPTKSSSGGSRKGSKGVLKGY